MKPDSVDPALLKRWMACCETHHGQDCMPRLGGPRMPFTWLVDAERMCLVPAPEKASYVALSYVWGKQLAGGFAPYTTTRSNVMKHIGERGLDRA